MRVVASAPPPAGNPTTKCTARAGHACAPAKRGNTANTAAPAVRCRNSLRRRIMPSGPSGNQRASNDAQRTGPGSSWKAAVAPRRCACGIMPVVAIATDRLAAIDSSVAPRPVLQPHSRGTGGNHAPAVDVHHLLAGWSVAHGRFRFVGRALLDALHRSRELHRELLRDVLAGLAPGRPHHRTALARGGGVSGAGVGDGVAACAGRYCWLGE